MHICVYTLFLLRLPSFQRRQRAVSRLGVVIESLPLSRAGDSTDFPAAFSSEYG